MTLHRREPRGTRPRPRLLPILQAAPPPAEPHRPKHLPCAGRASSSAAAGLPGALPLEAQPQRSASQAQPRPERTPDSTAPLPAAPRPTTPSEPSHKARNPAPDIPAPHRTAPAPPPTCTRGHAPSAQPTPELAWGRCRGLFRRGTATLERRTGGDPSAGPQQQEPPSRRGLRVSQTPQHGPRTPHARLGLGSPRATRSRVRPHPNTPA